MDNERNEKSILIKQGVTDRREDKIWSRKEKRVGHCKLTASYVGHSLSEVGLGSFPLDPTEAETPWYALAFLDTFFGMTEKWVAATIHTLPVRHALQEHRPCIEAQHHLESLTQSGLHDHACR